MNHKNIVSACAVLGNNFKDIVSFCNLKPLHGNWKKWSDCYQNKLVIKSNHNVAIFKSKNKLIKQKIHDIYFKSTFELISNNSYWLLFFLNQEKIYFWFIGNDGFLRVLGYFHKWQNYYPLLSGFKLLNIISENYKTGIDKPVSILPVCFDKSFKANLGYITKWPPNNKIKDIINRRIKID